MNRVTRRPFVNPYYHYQRLQKHLLTSREIATESLSLHIGSNWTQTGNYWFPSASQ